MLFKFAMALGPYRTFFCEIYGEVLDSVDVYHKCGLARSQLVVFFSLLLPRISPYLCSN